VKILKIPPLGLDKKFGNMTVRKRQPFKNINVRERIKKYLKKYI
jgi:hypothetical protein